MPLDLLATLRELVSTPSVNPMGRAVAGPEYFEYRVTDYLECLFSHHGIPTWRQPIDEKRDNLLVRIDGDPAPQGGGDLVLLEAHQDTVPVEGMTISPFDPQVRDGRLYGRGSCDIKGGMTAMLAAVVRLAEEQPKPRPTVVMACTVSEEFGFTGATGVCRLWSGQSNPMLSRRPDAAVIAEPTNLQVVVAHKGMVRWKCHTKGRAAHSSQPHQGQNAIFRMTKVLTALEQYQRDVVGTLADHSLCGKPTLSVGTISGGLSVNTVPDRCTIEIDRRLVPGEEPELVWRHVVDYVTTEVSLGNDVAHDLPYTHSRALGNTHNRALAQRLVAAATAATGRETRSMGVSFGTDAAPISAAGVPCVVFGPGSIEQAHTADEWVPLVEVEQAADALYRLIAGW